MATDIPAAEASPVAPYPMQIDIERQPEYDKLRAVIRSPYGFIVSIVWLLMMIPLVLVEFVLAIGALVLWIISWFAVLFTGRIPQGIFNYQVGYLRFAARVYSWMFILSDRYPTFSFDEQDHPMRVSIEYPEQVSRWRGIPLLTAILAIPAALVGGVLLFIGWLLIILPPIVPGAIQLCILFTGKYPEGLFNLVRGGVRISLRASAYSLMLVDKYPSFDF